MNELVKRLAENQPIEADLRPENSIKELRDACERNVVHLRFARTGTTLGLPIDRTRSKLDALASGAGSISLVGELVLNYEKVRFHAELELASLKGTGHLEHLENVDPWQRGA